jgi:CDP-paratose 2-epimerase
MSVAIITGSGGLIGSQAARHFSALGMHCVGIDNDMRGQLFGPDGSVQRNLDWLSLDLGGGYSHSPMDVRSRDGVDGLLRRYGRDVALVVHTAAQPAHDSADPLIDWDINATGTANVLEATRRWAPDAVVVVMSTIKVYGPHPNALRYVETETRYEIDFDYDAVWCDGFDESMSIDGGAHSIFGASKTAADLFAQEYGHYLGLRTVIFRGGCLTGAAHAGTEAHGMLSYLMRCVATGREYRIFGYGGKQVRDQIHAHDVATAMEAVWSDPPEPGTVYNIGGGRGANVSILEALAIAEDITGRAAKVEQIDEPRRGDHRWWITDMAKFRDRYPNWEPTYDVPTMMREIYNVNADRWPA